MSCHGIHVYSSCCIQYPDRARSNPSRSWSLLDTLTETPLEFRSSPVHDMPQLSQNPERDTLHPSRDHAIEKRLAQSTRTHEPQNQFLEVKEQLERIGEILIMALGVQVQHSWSQPLRVRRFAPNRSKLCATPWFIPCLIPYNNLVELQKTEVGHWLDRVVVICKLRARRQIDAPIQTEGFWVVRPNDCVIFQDWEGTPGHPLHRDDFDIQPFEGADDWEVHTVRVC